MKRNGMCPICYLKRILIPSSKIGSVKEEPQYGVDISPTPPMGWSSWNTFRNRIDENLIYETAVAMKEKGLVDAGYHYVNIDDNWVANGRDDMGRMRPDPLTFPHGIAALAKKVNDLGIKLGIYSSNGTETCEDLTASLYHERTDALTFAEWGIEYFKYDFCHNVPLSRYAPLIYGITLSNDGGQKYYPAAEAELSGTARRMSSSKMPEGVYISGLDRAEGAMVYSNIEGDGGEYLLSVNIKKKGEYKKCILAEINGTDRYYIEIPSQKKYNVTARFSVTVTLKKGVNTIKLFNPITSRADSAMLQYRYMGKMLKEATREVAEKHGLPEKPIVFSICEWGKNQPHKWGASAGNLWRTTGDIRPVWPWIMTIYRHNVKLYEYARKGAWNDPDMLEVGNGKLTRDENLSHFALWCMMSAPLILGNDLRTMPPEVLEIVTNKQLIEINQDELGVQAKRVKSGSVDILVKPLSGGRVAVLALNKSGGSKKYNLDLARVLSDKYSRLEKTADFKVRDVMGGEVIHTDRSLSVTLAPHGSAVYIIS